MTSCGQQNPFKVDKFAYFVADGQKIYLVVCLLLESTAVM